MASTFPKYSIAETSKTYPVIKIEPISVPPISANVVYYLDPITRIHPLDPFFPNYKKVRFYINQPFRIGTDKLIPTGDVVEFDAQNMPTIYPSAREFGSVFFWHENGFLWYNPNVVWRDNRIDDNHETFSAYFGSGGSNTLMVIDLGGVYTIRKISSKMQAYLYNGSLVIEGSQDGSSWTLLYYATDSSTGGWSWTPIGIRCWNGTINIRYLRIRESLGASVGGSRFWRIWEWQWLI